MEERIFFLWLYDHWSFCREVIEFNLGKVWCLRQQTKVWKKNKMYLYFTTFTLAKFDSLPKSYNELIILFSLTLLTPVNTHASLFLL